MNSSPFFKEETLQMSTGQTRKTSFSAGRAAGARTGRPVGFQGVAPVACAVLLLAAPSACRVAQAQTSGYYNATGTASADKGPTIDLDVANASLFGVVQALKLQSKAQIVVVSSKRYQPVTLTVTTSLADALQYVAQSAGAIVTRDANGVYTFQPATDASGAPAVTPAIYSTGYNPAPVAVQETTHLERIQLQYVSPNYILIMLKSPEGIIPSDPIQDPIQNSKLADPFQTPQMTSATNLRTEINPYQASNTGPYQPSVPLQDGSAPGSSNSANDSVYRGGSQAQQFVPGQFPSGGFGLNQTVNGGGGTINPYSTPGVGQTTPGFGQGVNGQNASQSIRPQGIDSMISDEQTNSLIVRGTPEGITELKQIIGFLDRAPRQVQIKVEYVTTQVNDVDQFGINWEFLPASNVATGFSGGGTASGATGSSYLTFSQGNVATQLLATLTTGHSKVVSSPIITTTNNTPASFNFSTEVPFETSSTTLQGSGNANTSTSVTILTIPNVLTITPRINGDDSVSLLLQPQLTSITAAGTATLPPTTSTQTVSTYRTVANGETMVIGGLVTKSVTDQQTRIPFLGDLPIIGSIFRTKNKSVNDSELLIFVTPTVLPPIGSGLSQTPVEAGGAVASGDSSAGVGVSP